MKGVPWLAFSGIVCGVVVGACGRAKPLTERAVGNPDLEPDGGGTDRQVQAGTDASADGPGPGALACSDLFDQSVLQDYAIDISADEWAKMQVDFANVAAVLAATPPENYHPIVFHRGAETVTNATIRLKGQSSWVETVQLDQPHPKMQFVIAFDQVDPNGKFHGVNKIDLDMPRSDWTFLHERLANTWLRQAGIMAPCSSSSKLTINGQYYGVYVNEESLGHHVVKTFYPSNSNGDLLKGGVLPNSSTTSTNWTREKAFWAATTIPAMTAIIDLPNSVLEWAADALLNNGDGYYGGSHNFYIYDQGVPGYVWVPADTDATFDWLGTFGQQSFDDHPIYWWEGRTSGDPPGQHYLTVINDPTWRARYVDAIATELGKWDTQQFQTWIDTWSAQISDSVRSDPNKWSTFAQFQAAVALARQEVAKRPDFLRTFVDCERNHTGADKDGDGVRWCDDCRDDNAAVHPGAAEICGNGIDDNCNGVIDEGCAKAPASTPAPSSTADAGVARD